MTQGVGILCLGNLHLSFGNQGTGKRSPQKIVAFINGISAKCRKNIVAHKDIFQVLNNYLLSSGAQSLFLQVVQLFSLADISGKGNHRALISLA